MDTRASHSRSVLITGCSSGFGRQMVTAFLKDDWIVFATLRKANERIESFKDELAQFGKRLIILECDVTFNNDRQSVREAVERTGVGLDCLINNAGYMLLGALEDTREVQLRAQMETNLFGAMLLTQELLPLLRQRRGSIINISSIFGFATWPLTSTYCASKYALEGFTQSLRQELEPHGVRVALLEPGSYSTALMANLRWGDRFADGCSIYSTETEAYRAFRDSLADRTNRNNSDVARAAVRIARSRKPRFRKQVGMGSKLVYFATRLCPEFFGVKIMGWLARRSFRTALAARTRVADITEG